MFKHGQSATTAPEPKKDPGDTILESQKAKGESEATELGGTVGAASPGHSYPAANSGELKELLEKNLKWSQIIYEQNRKINHKLMWSAIASWLRFLIILIPLVLGALLIPQLLRDYNCLIKGINCAENSRGSLENMLKFLPLDTAQREELKKIIK